MSRRGFTLLELLVALVCLAAVSVSSLSMLSMSHDRTVRSRLRMLVLSQACTEMDGALADGMRGAIAAGTTIQNSTVSGVPGTVKVTRTVAAVPFRQELFTVTVVATWNTDQVTLVSMVRNGIN